MTEQFSEKFKKHHQKCNIRGISLVELVVGMAILIFAAMSFSVTLLSLSKANVTNIKNVKVREKLQGVGDRIRGEALTEFYTMDETPDRHWDPNWGQEPDKNIQITFTIGEIHPIARTREIKIVADWTDERYDSSYGACDINTNPLPVGCHVKVSEFTLSFIRAEAQGAKLKLKVIQEGTGFPLEGILITVPGQNIPELTRQTDVNGICLFSEGVLVSPTDGVKVKVDASPKRHYFANGGEDGLTYSFFKYFQSGPTPDLHTDETLFDNPIEATSPQLL
ncbi:hypothetical protein BVX98_01720 [bacterium F11]|nr:hypothetical protein BVX98_01720 [bacterium F11]